MFGKHCLTLFVSGREKNAHFRAHYLFCPIFLGPKTVKTRKNYKNSRFSGHLFFGKKVFWGMGEKVFFTNCVFEKLCFLKTLFYSVSSKHSNCSKKDVCWKTENLLKIVGCFWTWQKGVFCLLFQVFMFLWFFCVFGKVAKVLNMLFSQFFWLLEGGIVLFIWVWNV